MFRAHVLETCGGMKLTYCKTKILCTKLVNYWDKYTEMHRQQNVKKDKQCTYNVTLRLILVTIVVVEKRYYKFWV